MSCFNCNEEGHISRECPNKKNFQRKSFGDKVCFNCNETGHFSRECPQGGNRPSRGGSGGGGGRRSFSSSRDNSNSDCRNCHESGHLSQNCGNLCTYCRDNDDGHKRRDCPRASGCRNCYESGHNSWECESECKLCRDNYDGHMRKDCTRGAGARFGGRGGRGGARGGGGRGGRFGGSSNSACFNCNEVGHMSRDCPQRGSGGRDRGDSVNFIPVRGRRSGFGGGYSGNDGQYKRKTFDDDDD